MSLNPTDEAPDLEADDFHDLMEAAASALGVWDNALDDESWNQLS
jgi:hypothetical protein